jgi:hypothetical protein
VKTLKRALLVGLDEYLNFSPLSGCVNDVRALEPLLARDEDGGVAFACVTRTAPDEVQRDALLTDLDALLASGADVAVLYFAGHGAAVDNDLSLCTHDGSQQTPGVALSEVLSRVARSPVPEIVIILDCCFAGAAGGIPQLGTDIASLRAGLSILAASRGDQVSAETADGRGLFSSYLCGALEGGAADVLGRVTIAGLYSYLDESFGPWDQRPVFRANVDRLHDLRHCAPAVPVGGVRRLRNFFSTPTTQMPLDPSYEPDAEPTNAENEAVFAILQQCRAAKLIEPVDAEHMYFAAMQRKACRLTPLGRHYWLMIDQDLL